MSLRNAVKTNSLLLLTSFFCHIFDMSQPACHVGFALHPHRSFPTDRTLFLAEGPVFGGSGWCSTTVQTTNSWSACWVQAGSLQPASTPQRPSRASTTSRRQLHTWPASRPSFARSTMPRNEPTQWCAVPMVSSGARVNSSFSSPCAPRRKVRFGSPVQGGGDWRTSSRNAPLFCNMHSVPQGARMISFQNGNGQFGHSRC